MTLDAKLTARMEARVSYDANHWMWVVETRINESTWEQESKYHVSDVTRYGTKVDDKLLWHLMELQRDGWTIIFYDPEYGE